MKYAYIAGTGSYLPEKILSNSELEKLINTTDEWIRERCGIQQRHIAADDETSASMGKIAVERALQSANISPSQIDLIIVATSTSDRVFPSTACFIQEMLGINQCIAFDVTAACAGFNYALSVADQFIKTGQASCAVVVGSEVMSRIIDWQDRGTCILFGDGAGAVVLTAADKPGIIATKLHADGKYKNMLYTPNPIANIKERAETPYMKMQGSEVFKFAVKSLGELVTEILDKNYLPAGKSIDWLIPHQANLRIIAATAKKLNLAMDKVVLTIDQHGNTSSASVPLALDIAVRDGRIQRGHYLLLESFGGGFTWGSALIQY